LSTLVEALVSFGADRNRSRSGDAADGRLRASSDVNVLVVIRQWTQAAADALRQPMRVAAAAVRLAPMSYWRPSWRSRLRSRTFSSDMARRHRVIFGNDPFVHYHSGAAPVARERQALQPDRPHAAFVPERSPGEQAQRAFRPCGPLRGARPRCCNSKGRNHAPKEALRRSPRAGPSRSCGARNTSAVRATAGVSRRRCAGPVPLTGAAERCAARALAA
jgi:hypothetical protein